jgi:hypothetical protein
MRRFARRAFDIPVEVEMLNIMSAHADQTSATHVPEVRTVRTFNRFFTPLVRILLGLPLFVFGLNGFLNFLPQPEVTMSAGAMDFTEALMKSGYMLSLIFGTQFIVGALLLLNRFVPLALVLLAPFIVNSMAFHIFLEHTGLPFASVFLLAELYLAWQYRKSYGSVLAMKAVPGSRRIQ